MRLQNFCNERSLSLWQAIRHIEMVEGINEPTRLRLQNFASIIDRARIKMTELPVAELTNFLLQAISFETFIRDHTEEGEERWRNVQELLTVMKKYDGLPPMEGLTSFLEEVALISEVDKLDKGNQDSLTLMTLHLCKGLEFQSVIVAGCEEGLLPHSSSLFDSVQMEEERRLLYVGMTRAKAHLSLFYAMSRSQWGSTQSNARSRFFVFIYTKFFFVACIVLQSKYGWLTSSQKPMNSFTSPSRPARPVNEFNQDNETEDDADTGETDDISDGTIIEHKTLGRGTVLDRSGDIVEVQFESGARKKLALNIAPVRIVKN
jgi:DNA helicase-2/ATP-dependent DNA helicase PcrA